MKNDINDYALRIHDLTVIYDNKPVLWDIDLEIPKGRIVAIVGPNGAGKTTLIKAVLGLLKPISGAVEFNFDKDYNKYNIGYVPQSDSIDWNFPVTVLDVVLMGTYGKLGWVRRPGKQERTKALECLEKVGMKSYSNRQISQLSGGEQQRVFLARALIQNADIYFMDEPFKGIDVKTQSIIFEILEELKEVGKTIVIVHHDLQTIKDYFDWIVLINIIVIATGPVLEIFNDDNIKKTYKSNSSLIQSGDVNG